MPDSKPDSKPKPMLDIIIESVIALQRDLMTHYMVKSDEVRITLGARAFHQVCRDVHAAGTVELLLPRFDSFPCGTLRLSVVGLPVVIVEVLHD